MTIGAELSRIWDEATGTQPAPHTAVVLGAGLVALALVTLPSAWRVARHAVTLAHEAAHGAAALLVGRQLHGIRLHSDTSGLTVSSGRRGGPGMVLTAAAGYPGPALLGLGAAALLGDGHALGVLWLAVVLLALMLVQIRNWFGLWSVPVAGVGVFAVSWWGTAHQQSAVAYGGTWFLLLAAPRAAVELALVRRRGRARDTDADLLARVTRLPAPVWVALFVLICLGALLLGARWIV